MAPWLIFMFVGAMDWGFYAYALIATESAARVGCLYASSSSSTATDSTTVCTKYALEQLRRMSNVGSSMNTCASGSSVSASSPVGVTVTQITGADGNPAAQVSVTYLTPIYIPMVMNGNTLMPKQVAITRTIQMRLRG